MKLIIRQSKIFIPKKNKMVSTFGVYYLGTKMVLVYHNKIKLFCILYIFLKKLFPFYLTIKKQ